MQVESLAEHPKVVGHHEVVQEHVQYFTAHLKCVKKEYRSIMVSTPSCHKQPRSVNLEILSLSELIDFSQKLTH